MIRWLMVVNIKMTMLITWSDPRESIKEHFECLLDTEMQKSWFDPNYPHAFWDSLVYYVKET
ncbi:MAG: hypothetical protein PV347_01260 [Rickettsiaceae bacterium]|nr:hypothetical protein [Rickettsiaceae bacterium]MDD9337002.1 hypothetical protein [Rickettsiaceae bacterium]